MTKQTAKQLYDAGKRAHIRTDFEYHVYKGKPRFCRAAYMCVITQSTAYPDERCLYHVEFFYGHNGVAVRADARRYGSAIVKGKACVRGYRNQYIPTTFPAVPWKREDRVIVR